MVGSCLTDPNILDSMGNNIPEIPESRTARLEKRPILCSVLNWTPREEANIGISLPVLIKSLEKRFTLVSWGHSSGWFLWQISTWQCAIQRQLRALPSTATRRILQTEGEHGSCSLQRPELSAPVVGISSSRWLHCKYIAKHLRGIDGYKAGSKLADSGKDSANPVVTFVTRIWTLDTWICYTTSLWSFLLIGLLSPASYLETDVDSQRYLLRWVALWRPHHNDNCPMLPEITIKSQVKSASGVYAPAKHVAVQPCSLPCTLELN